MSSELTSKQKKEWAQLLFVKEDMTQKAIALKVGVSEVTMSNWVTKENWDSLKISLIRTKQQELTNLYRQLEEQNAAIKKRDEGARFANSKEMDVIIKLTGAIKNLENETTVGQAFDVFQGYFNFLRQIDLKEAQRQTDFADAYIKTLFKK